MKKLHSARAFLAGIPAALHKPVKLSLPALTLALALFLTAGLAVGASAAANRKQIVAYENYAIAIKLDGEVQTPTDANGKRVYPISYNGTTYLPIRAVAKMLGIGVDWEQATQTVLLGDPAEGVDLVDNFKPYYADEDCRNYQTADKKSYEISGKTYSHWAELGMPWAADIGALRNLSYNIDGKYDTLTFQYYSPTDVLLRVLGDNDSKLAEITIKGGQVAKSITVDLLGTSQLTFQGESLVNPNNPWGGYSIYILDAKLK